MADQTDDEHDHTDDEHERHADQAQEIFSSAVEKCLDAKLCEMVVFEELVARTATEAIVHEISLAELVSDVIETYLMLQQDDAVLKAALTRTAEKPDGN